MREKYPKTYNVEEIAIREGYIKEGEKLTHLQRLTAIANLKMREVLEGDVDG